MRFEIYHGYRTEPNKPHLLQTNMKSFSCASIRKEKSHLNLVNRLTYSFSHAIVPLMYRTVVILVPSDWHAQMRAQESEGEFSFFALIQ